VEKAKRRPCHLCSVKEGTGDGAQAPAVSSAGAAHTRTDGAEASKNSDYYTIDYCVEWLVLPNNRAPIPMCSSVGV
jgi:hypothetical protein